MSKKKITPITKDEWIQATFTKLPGKPEGAITMDDIIEKTDLSRAQTNFRLKNMVAKGELKMGKFLSDDGYIHNYYIPIEK